MSQEPVNALDLRFVRQSFDQASAAYDRHAVLQHEVGERLLERLDYLQAEPALILDSGCGTGLAGQELANRYPAARVIGLDWSTGMLNQLAARSSTGPVPLCADMHRIPLAARSADLLFSNLALQWSPDPGDWLNEARRVLKPGGMLLFSTFGPDTLHELRSAWAVADERPHVNRFIDMHDIGDLAVAAGFTEPVLDVDVITLEYRDVVSLMRDLKAIGAHNAALDRSTGLTGRKKFQQVLDAYEVFRSNDRYPATYEVIYGAAFGPREGQPVRGPEGEVVTFSVDALKTRGKGEMQ